MDPKIELWELPPSFNSRKVRYALGAKRVAYTRITVPPGGEATVVQVSGQPLTPVLRHGALVMFDSGAIVRYIDANIPGPRLFSPDAAEMRAIEAWESRARVDLLAPYLQIMSQVKSSQPDAARIAEGKERFIAGAATVQQALNGHGVLVGQALSAADIFCGCYLAYAFLTEEEAAGWPGLEWSLRNLSLLDDPGFGRLAAWFERLRVLDPPQPTTFA
jgi:glutathione S-transferase